jgi:putative ABC transport system permease protein
LSVDSSIDPKLYSFLKRTPAVSGVNVREAMIQSFRDTIAESLGISISALIAFACVIAFGIVYNSALIALSERAHELASLRVLGFTRNEIGWMLLGEQAILAGTSIPLGFLLGYGICAFLVRSMQSELYRMPLVISSRTYALAFITVTVTSVVSALFISRKLHKLDLIAVLKARE